MYLWSNEIANHIAKYGCQWKKDIRANEGSAPEKPFGDLWPTGATLVTGD